MTVAKTKPWVSSRDASRRASRSRAHRRSHIHGALRACVVAAPPAAGRLAPDRLRSRSTPTFARHRCPACLGGGVIGMSGVSRLTCWWVGVLVVPPQVKYFEVARGHQELHFLSQYTSTSTQKAGARARLLPRGLLGGAPLSLRIEHTHLDSVRSGHAPSQSAAIRRVLRLQKCRKRTEGRLRTPILAGTQLAP